MLRLTNREKEVDDLLGEGMTRADIAKSLNISRVNLRDIIRRIKNKTLGRGVESPEVKPPQDKPREVMTAPDVPDGIDFKRLKSCILLFREGYSNKDIANELKCSQLKVMQLRDILVELKMARRERP
jgi:DNA-binding NarL/FixJ family response regulator